MRVGWPSWSVEIADDWHVTEHSECLTLELSGEAALQISSAKKSHGAVTDSDLFEIVGDREGHWGDGRPIVCGEFNGLLFEYTEIETVWRRWFLRAESTVVFATYNGSADAEARERLRVDQVLRTLRLENG